jgi:putative copper export protein
MTMTPRLRRLALITHITSSVGWAGAIVAYLALAIAGLASRDTNLMRAARQPARTARPSRSARWVVIAIAAVVAVVLVMAMLHLHGGGPRHH